MNRKVVFAQGEYYHLYNRGTEKRRIFLSPADHRRFLALLYLCNGHNEVNLRETFRKDIKFEDIFEIDKGAPLVAVGAYCLMPNHFHILAKESAKYGVSKFMQKLGTAYSMYFNVRHHRVGTLFQGKFKARHVTNDQYLKYLYAYIHLNPVKLIDNGWREHSIVDAKKAEQYIKEYSYSSFGVYLNMKARPTAAILAPKDFPAYFRSTHEFSEMHREWLNFKEPE
jgi:REP element-mobilizing transposase RayT